MKWCLIYVFLFSFITNAQTITTFAGGGTVIGDGGPATAAILNQANGGAFDKHGNFYVCEVLGHRVRKINPSGIITRVAGTGTPGALGDGGPATAAQLSEPTDVVVDTFGNIYISDLNNFKIRKVDAVTGFISTVVGTGVAGYNGDGIAGTAAQLQGNEQIWVDKTGNLFICDRGNTRVRKLNTAGIISTVAGGTFSGTGSGDGSQATAAGFNLITGVAVDDTGNIFIADYNTGKIRKVNTLGIINTIAGNGLTTYIGDGIPATAAQMNPSRLTFDTAKNLVIADQINRRILKIDHAGIIHSIAGNGSTGFFGDGGPATAATLDFPAGVTYDPCGNLYISESAPNKRVRKVTFNSTCDPTLIVDLERARQDIFIYPNPVYNKIIVVAPFNIKEVAVSDILERNVIKAKCGSEKMELDVLSLPAGMYILQLADEYGTRTVHKIIKQ